MTEQSMQSHATVITQKEWPAMPYYREKHETTGTETFCHGHGASESYCLTNDGRHGWARPDSPQLWSCPSHQSPRSAHLERLDLACHSNSRSSPRSRRCDADTSVQAGLGNWPMLDAPPELWQNDKEILKARELSREAVAVIVDRIDVGELSGCQPTLQARKRRLAR